MMTGSDADVMLVRSLDNSIVLQPFCFETGFGDFTLERSFHAELIQSNVFKGRQEYDGYN